jgi:hypothetical protein
MFDENLQLGKTAKYVYGTYLILVFAICLYWTGSQTGPAVPLIKLQALLFNGRYFGVPTVFVLALPLGLAGNVVIHLLDRSGLVGKKPR